MNIAYIMHGTGWGGSGGSLLLLLKSLKNYSKARKFFYTTIDRENQAKVLFIEYTDLYKEYQLPSLKNDLAGGQTSLKAFRKIINGNYSDFIEELVQQHIDIIHINSTVLCYLLKPIKEITNIKTVMHVREIMPRYDNGEVQNYMLNTIQVYSDVIICISNNEANQFFNKEKIIILPNPFDFNVLKEIKSSYRKNNSISKDVVLIAMGGTFTRLKGHKLFLEAIKWLLDNYKISYEVKFLIFGVNKINPLWKVIIKKILGKKDYGYKFISYIRKNDLNHYISIYPVLYTNDYYDILNDIDIYVRPALSKDPWGRDIIEAMAFGKPILATGTSDFFINNGINGFLIDSNNPEQLAEKMQLLINNKNIRKEFGLKGKEICKNMCDLNRYQQVIIKIYEGLTNKV